MVKMIVAFDKGKLAQTLSEFRLGKHAIFGVKTLGTLKINTVQSLTLKKIIIM